MKKTIISLIALTGLVGADTINPITEGDWTTGSRLNRPTWTQTDSGTLALTNSNWSQAYAIFDLEENITGAWEATTTIERYDGHAGFTLTFVGLDTAITIGTQNYRSGTAYYGTTTNVTANGYSFEGELYDIGGTWVEAMQFVEGVFNVNQSAWITASAALDADSNVILTLTLAGSAVDTPFTTTLNLGQGFELDKIVVWGDGDRNFTSNHWVVTEMTLTTPDAPEPSTPSVPEPTTATLSLLALAGLAARRRRK